MRVLLLGVALAAACGGRIRSDPVESFHPEGRTEGDRIAAAHRPAPPPPTDASEGLLREERGRRHALAHRQAALLRHAGHEAACAAVPQDIRAECPFDGALGVASVEDVAGGIRVVIDAEDEDEVAALVARARCHAAQGAHADGAAMADCPFYVRDVQVRAVSASGRAALELTTHHAELVPDLRARVRALAVVPDGEGNGSFER